MSSKTIGVHPAVQLAWAVANAEACRAGSRQIEPVHFLLAVLKIADDASQQDARATGVPSEVLDALPSATDQCRSSLGMSDRDITQTRRALSAELHRRGEEGQLRMLHRSVASRELFARAAASAARTHSCEMTLVDILKELLAQLPPQAVPFLGGLEPERSADPTGPSKDGRHRWGGSDDLNPTPQRSVTPTIDEIGRDLRVLAAAGRLTPVFGREAETKALARYLHRTQKRNVILVGDAGVGKTAIVEGLAQRLAAGNAPELLRDLRIVQINVADLIAGTTYRGDMEGRVQCLISEATADPDLVLFLDEIHLVMKAGSGSESPMDVANLLKPALSGDEFRCIGATTTEEFDRYIRGDTAFARRFQVVTVPEPREHETLHICRESARRIERLQHVVVDDDAVITAVRLSTLLLHGRSQPDKAIDLLENAAAFAKVSSLTFRNVRPSKEPLRISSKEIESVLEEQYGVNVRRSTALDLTTARTVLDERLVGQPEAVGELLEGLSALATRGDESAGPLGVFLFTGPTGVGKTYSAECLSKALFGEDGRSLGRFNMSEYKERHELARLIGAPPGFVGHGEPAALFRFVESNPQGLILLDEMEKAHPEIQDYFLQIFDKGEASDQRGRKVSFSRHLFVLTCNVAPRPDLRMGFRPGDASKRGSYDDPHAALREHFRAEFLARVDRIISFRSLDVVDLRLLFDQRVALLARDLQDQYGLSLRVDEEVLARCVRSAKQAEGARGVHRMFEREIAAAVIANAHKASAPGVITVELTADGVIVVDTVGKLG